MLKVYGDEMPFSKDGLGGKTEEDGSDSAKMLDLHKILLQWKCKDLFKSIDGKNENIYIHYILGKFKSSGDGSSHALAIHLVSLRY
ncbi:hypothetical protein [Peribacillus frigoritolerans]|uniref:hypothetical protein n=1 Tax=Peribacillus frigoritolerans TaxID=450367 RepID=UPI002079A127|nr:hypothetical protein [Peribacillus frigoritolerans]USK73126.1 hypothetical protein LIT31_14805 [Peribacillus frigoritolerans]